MSVHSADTSAVGTPTALVKVTSISKTFGEQRALDDISMTIRPGQIHALVGENGSGKSTLIKILAGYYIPDDGGSVEVDGTELTRGNPAATHALGLRFVHQNLGLVDELSAVDNIGLIAGFSTRATRIQPGDARRVAAELIGRLKMSIDLDCPVSELRPVERSAVAIARTLASADHPLRLLVLDEPTAALPPTEVEALFDVVRGLRADGMSVLYVSHRLDEILALSDEVSVLRDGRFQGTFAAQGLSRDDIVEHIIGTEAASAGRTHAARTISSSVQADGANVLTVTGLTTQNLLGVDLAVRPGEILGIAGLEGSGREDLAAALGGAIDATGTLTDQDGRSWSRLTSSAALEHGIALVLANWHPASAIHEFDLRENVSLTHLSRFSRAGRVRRRAEADAALEWLRKVDVRPLDASKHYGLLSGGNKQKVIVAKWLAISPRVIVLDDPTSGVDIGARHQIYDLLRAEAAKGVGIVLCSSDLEDLVEVCDRAVCLVGGRVSRDLSGPDLNESELLAAVVTRHVDETASTQPQVRNTHV